MRRVLVTMAVAAMLACSNRPSDPPRPRVVVCAGDSNTGMMNSWCDMLARELPLTAWRFINVSRWGTTARFWLTNDWIHRLVTTSHPDVVVLALGTNDACDTPPAGIVDELIKLARQAGEGCPTGAGPPTLPATTCPRVIIATIPPLYEGGPFLTCQPTVERANDLLHEAWPPYLLADFDSWVTGPELYWPDGIHLTDEGQHRRAAEARNAIFRALAE